MSTHARTEALKRLKELIEEGVLEESGPKEVVITDEFLDILEESLKGLRAQENGGLELPEDLLMGATMLSYLAFRGGATDAELRVKVNLILNILELVKEGRLEEWSMITRIRRR